jgi:MFS family permease
MYFWVVPPAVFGPSIAYGFVQNTSVSWRGIYYLLITTNGLACICWILFYHPPTFVMLNRRSRLQLFRDFDWPGIILFSGGLIIFLMGLSWGGVVYSWDSGKVVGTLVGGGVALITFTLWEIYNPMNEPLVPMNLFTNIGTYLRRSRIVRLD